MTKVTFRIPGLSEQTILDTVIVRPLTADEQERARYGQLMTAHHYLKSDHLVGEQLRYVAEVAGQWVALLSWSAASYHLKDRDQWIGWSDPQRRRRLALVANNSRFLILPGVDCPNLASRLLALCLARLSADWQATYDHPILLVESFVDSQLFRGTCYKAQGWTLLGATKGFERARQDYYVAHDRPKQLWVRELDPSPNPKTNARAHLRAAQLPPHLQAVEDRVIPRTTTTPTELSSLWHLCRSAPDWRKTKGKDYHLATLLAIIIMATLCGIVRGQRDLAAFAAKLTQAQLRALRSYLGRDKRYQAPKETTFQRVLRNLDPVAFESILHTWEAQLLGPSETNGDHLTALDGKAQCGSTPEVKNEQKPQLVSAQSLPSGRVLATVLVEAKSNEIPAARELLTKIGPSDGKLIMLDALHTNQATLRQILQDNGADYLLPIKENHDGLLQRAQQTLPAPAPPNPPNPPNPPTQSASSAGPSPLWTKRPPAPPSERRPQPPTQVRTQAPPTSPAPVRYRRDRRKKPLPPRKAQPAGGRHHP